MGEHLSGQLSAASATAVRRLPARRTLGHASLAVASGLLLWAAFPPLDWGVIGWVALAPLFCLMLRRSLLENALFGFTAGLVFFAGLLYYIGQFGLIPWLALAALEALFFLAAAVVGSAAAQRGPRALRPLALAAAWTLAMYLRGHAGALSLPLGDLGYTQHSTGAVLQLAAAFGVHGVTFLMVAVNAALAECMSTGGRPHVGATAFHVAVAAAVVATISIGRLHELALQAPLSDTGESVRVAAIQAAEWPPRRVTPEFVRRTVAVYRRLSLRGKADLIVWPETALLGDPSQHAAARRNVADTARRSGAWLLYGNAPFRNKGRRNAATLLDQDGRPRAEYSKVHLVVFGEYVPYRDRLRFVERFPVRETDFVPGDEFVVMETDRLRFSPLICFESLFPDYSRECVRMGAEAIVIITSDAWAGQTAELAQHANCSRFRAVEAGRYVVRAATTGLTMIIGPNGEVLAHTPPYQPGAAGAEIQPREHRTPYSRWGDWPVLGGCLLALGLALWRRRE